MGEATRKTGKFYPDYISAVISADVKWVTDSFAKDRRIALYGIDVALSQEGSELSIDPVIPCMGQLCKLVKKYASCSVFRFDKVKQVWRSDE